VDPTKQPTGDNFEVLVDGVQSNSKLFGMRAQTGIASSKQMKKEKLTWYTLYCLLIGRNLEVRDPLPSVDDIAVMAKNV
jgi:hypothetical protein